MDNCAIVNFWIQGIEKQFARRQLYYIPNQGDLCVFNEKRYKVMQVEWCLDETATKLGVRVNIELEPLPLGK